MKPIIDPRLGDIENDASSTKSRSLLSLAGTLLTEISLPKLAVTWVLLILLPGLLLGMAPVVASIWLSAFFDRVEAFQAGLWSAAVLAVLLAVALFSSRRLFRLAERNFWALNALAVQPIYAACREAMRQLFEGRFAPDSAHLAKLRAAAALVSGFAICAISLWVLAAAWPSTLIVSDIAILHAPWRLARAALANSAVLVSAYVAVAALAWAIADATMDQPHDLERFDEEPRDGATSGAVWRVAHLSDIHVVGENYGFRIESGRSGPRGNERLDQAFIRLEALHAADPLHAILITGDVTDAGLSTEWAEFLDIVARHPAIADLIVMAPGNHDLNIVDRANPARLDLPTSPNKKLRKLRVLSAMATLHGERVRVVDEAAGRLGGSLATALAPFADLMSSFVDSGKPWFSQDLSDLWAKAFPLVVAPDREDGLGMILLNSSADTHFSFTNALGMVSMEQVRALEKVMALYPTTCWVVALHHHLVEYPRPAKALSERIGTALVNGNWFVRRLRPLAGRVVAMHGHRHIDWVGECAGLRLVSAPSPVMDAKDRDDTCFYVHRLAIGPDRRLKLLQPQKIVLAGLPKAQA
ncbi:metallophosphoesterase [Rhodoblastus sp. 17X3]|uniref:metallophosphoesterase family protein n=1 Tax=Rhodoblastus sp. 17X3 TaxID=3047026 RepID=UPI0024B6DE72|nr:metallophosphoesterase [Rhodoblastus sp. 17X3]MDI9847485.1 metallophosphoesterase [Rhodoblastus sp. 17X3]